MNDKKTITITMEEYKLLLEKQKQVDELKEERYYTEQDTAKEILVPLLKICTFEDNETALDDKVVELAERYGIEVE